MKKIVLIGFLLISAVILAACSPKIVPATPEVENLAKCLTEKGAVFYGTEWCPHCQDQKEMFGSAMEYIVFVDCDENRDACVDAGIKGYPTWIIGNETLTGTQQLFKLSQVAQCPISSLSE